MQSFGNVKLDVGPGNDLLQGKGGNHKVKGGSSNDKIKGGAGADKIQGGEDMDTVDGGKGKDKLEGGKGADVFICDIEDTIKDFNSQDGDSITGGFSPVDEGIPNLNKLASENNSQF